MRGFWCSGLALLLAAGAFAQDIEKCDGSTYEMSVCLSAILKKVEADLADVYQRALKATDSRDLKNLKVAQARWIAYRDAACKAEYELYGRGSGGPNALGACKINLTKQRISDLVAAYGKK